MITELQARERQCRMRGAAYALFKERGVYEVTLGEVCEKAGISESSIYRYFKTKANLLMETYSYLWEEIAAELRTRTIGLESYRAATGYAQMELLTAAFGKVYLSREEYLRFAVECELYWMRSHYEVDVKRYDAMIAPIVDLFRQALLKGEADGTVCLPGEAAEYTLSVWGLFRGYLQQLSILDSFYDGTNRLKANLELTRVLILKALRRRE